MQDVLLDQSDSDYRIATELYTPEELETAARDGDAYTPTEFREAIEALRAAPPVPEPVRLTRQSARRLAMQIAWAQLKQTGWSRADRRRHWHTIKFSDAARALVASSGSVTNEPDR